MNFGLVGFAFKGFLVSFFDIQVGKIISIANGRASELRLRDWEMHQGFRQRELVSPPRGKRYLCSGGKVGKLRCFVKQLYTSRTTLHSGKPKLATDNSIANKIEGNFGIKQTVYLFGISIKPFTSPMSTRKQKLRILASVFTKD